MRILVVTPHPPAFPGSGAAARVFHLMRELADRHRFFLIAGTCWGDPVDRTRLEAICERVEIVAPAAFVPSGGVWRRRLRRWRREWFGPPAMVTDVMRLQAPIQAPLEAAAAWRPDRIHVHHSVTLPLLDGGPPGVPVLVDMHNVMFEFYRRTRQAAPTRREGFEAWREARKMWRFERARFDERLSFITTSDDDAAIIAREQPAARTRVVPNGVDVNYFDSAAGGDPDRVLFMGTLSYPPNADAVTWLAAEILPAIRAVRPSVRLDLVGMDPPPSILALADGTTISLHASVPDVRPYAVRSPIHLVPLRSGSGTRLKILEALAMRRAVVSTTMGAEGLDLRPEADLLIADDAAAFTAQVLRLLDDPALSRRLGEEGRRRVEARYSWTKVAAQLDAVYREDPP